ncbi:anti-anti-sigma factor [Fictibacillus sp. WQ 8-8]|uniref:STAS domain-containing protein n=1 Tax=Fictibacillus sp. WQ 8-8 TaxID=2938788 RepID=UPI0020C8F5CE|nr:STAS domain-containing protein [Fictibacillus sp. WQ 8-8]MCQ6268638.1 anti-anti-sigma factor [Fictibacillus sp. WQ 8-8]
MNSKKTIPVFYSLRSLSSKLFALISDQLNVNTAYVTRRGETAMHVLSSFNKEEEIIPEGYSVEYGGTYCRLIIMNEGDVMHTSNLMTQAVTKELEVTGQLNVKGFLGVTLKDLKGNVFGTLCVMDREERKFSEADVAYLRSMADILSYVIELDETKYNMSFLSVPIIPIKNGISILSLQGIVDDDRSHQILSDVLHDAADNDIDYFIIDLSKLLVHDDTFSDFFYQMINALNLMGVETIITGVTPVFAREQVDKMDLQVLNTRIVKDIQSALDYIGYTLIQKR